MLIRSAEIAAQTLTRSKELRGRIVRLVRHADDGVHPRPVTSEQKRARLGELVAELGNLGEAHDTLERLIGGNELSPINYLARGTAASRAVCRVELRDDSGQTVGFGTGFLVAPGVLMTNHHVIGALADARHALAEFDYELDLLGRERAMVQFSIMTEPSPIFVQALDFCLVAVSAHSSDGHRALEDFGWLPLDPTPGKAFIGEYLTIIQHPGGERKQVCVRENKLIKYDDSGATLWYQTDTVAGSSGSPVFNNSWQVVALHHSGIPRTDSKGNWLTVDGQIWDQSMGDERVAWIANEGIRVSQIVQHLANKFADHPLAQRVLHVKPSPLPSESAQTSAPAARAGRYENGELHIPLAAEIVVRLGTLSAAGVGVPTPPSMVPGTATPPMPSRSTGGNGLAASMPGQILGLDRPTPAGVESVSVDQSNYAARTGYDSAFLGDGALRIPLPTIGNAKTSVLKFKQGSKQASVLKYWNYSVVMNRQRRLAFVSAVNVDASLRPTNAGRDGDRWFTDTRIPAASQIGAEFYGEQKTFELDRSKNPFDRGHLCRRLDVQWGTTEALGKRNGDDSFHWTNCSPQHWKFNQGTKRWLGLEDFVITTFAKATHRACVFNGPVFDAPLSVRSADGRIIPQIDGRSHKDPTFGGVSIPKQFYKIVATANGSKLIAAAFLMSQEDFLLGVDRLKGMPALADEILSTAEARLYQVAIADIEKLTGLDFGALKTADTNAREFAESGPRLISDARQIRV